MATADGAAGDVEGTAVEPVTAAQAFVDERFPECSVAVVGGSVFRGARTPTSDLDIVIVTDREDAPFRASYLERGWPVEAFIHTERSFWWFVEREVERRRPTLTQIWVEGVVLRDTAALAGRIRAEAAAILQRGPAPLTDDEVTGFRYRITDALDDLIGSSDEGERLLIASDLAAAATELILLSRGRWIGRGKWVIRALRQVDTGLAEALERSLLANAAGDREPLTHFAEEALRPHGGRLFEGYYAQGPREVR
jgi:hypothetical protein